MTENIQKILRQRHQPLFAQYCLNNYYAVKCRVPLRGFTYIIPFQV